MASCDDDFALLGDETTQPHHHHPHHHHHHQTYGAHHNRFVPTKPSPSSSTLHHAIPATSPPKKQVGPTPTATEDDYGDSPFCSQPDDPKCPPPNPSYHPHDCFGDNDEDDVVDAPVNANDAPVNVSNPNGPSNLFADDDPDRKSAGRGARCDKRKDRDDLSDGGTANTSSAYCFKKSKAASSSANCSDYRKDREEWSDSAIGCLLDAYMDKFVQLNRGNLRGRDWVDVAAIVSERADRQKMCCDKQKMSKSVEQCKNKMDNLKKRYKVELQRMNSSGTSVSHWTWFKKMEQIVGSSVPSKSAVSDEDKSVTGSALVPRTKRYPVVTPTSVGVTNNMKTKPMSNPRWRRVVFKISGAVLAGNGPQNVDPKVMMLIAREIATANRLGVEVAIVAGGRNFFCGDTWVATTGIDRATTYQLGMMATVMNSILLQASLEKMGVQTRLQTTFTMQEIAEPYNRQRAIRHLEKGRVVIFGGIGAGLGNPLFTTDTAAALRASEINADAVLKGTNVDGVYDCHSRNSNGMTFEHISFREFVSRGFTAMDMTAISCCEENGIPVVIFNLLEPGNISRALCGDQVGTLIDQSGRIS
ncbi:uncharacterized protein LOC131234774 isoform X2 [Magnolia sinica]|uniref:uncharacterized protein LOC131234774 isoform X2 n=1 Tax=Magnolia sinica TaxID=86752 RepID=UPI002657C851|nr:uncharacterized protein LOC131234774 isoform X2 [Magnolia sinica]